MNTQSTQGAAPNQRISKLQSAIEYWDSLDQAEITEDQAWEMNKRAGNVFEFSALQGALLAAKEVGYDFVHSKIRMQLVALLETSRSAIAPPTQRATVATPAQEPWWKFWK